MRNRFLPSVLLISFACPSLAPAVSRTVVDATPSRTLAALYRAADGQDATQASAESIAAFATRMQAMGVLRMVCGPWHYLVDGLRGWPLIRRLPRAYLLHDIGLRRSEGSNHLAHLRLSIILQTNHDNQPVEDLVQHFISLYTNNQSGRLSTRQVDGATIHRLVDSSLPDWVVWEWGVIGGLYVVSLGEGSFDSVRRAHRGTDRLNKDSWFASSHDNVDGSAAQYELFANLDGLRRTLGRTTPDRVEQFIDALGLKDVDRLLATVGRRDRAVVSHAATLSGDKRVVNQIAGPVRPGSDEARLIPDAASWYAVLDQSSATMIKRLRDAYLALQDLDTRYRLNEMWGRLAAERSLDVERDFFAPLGDTIVIHNAPPHPWGLPLMWNVLMRIDRDPAEVRSALDNMLDYTSMRLDLAAQQQSGFRLRPVLKRSQDGLWLLQYGIYGPSAAVAGDWLCLSFAPGALRSNIARLTGEPAPVTSRPADTESNARP